MIFDHGGLLVPQKLARFVLAQAVAGRDGQAVAGETGKTYLNMEADKPPDKRRFTETMLLYRTVGGVPCGACEAERVRLNGMMAKLVQAKFDLIVEATIQRAKALPRWWDRIRAKVGDAVAPERLRRLVGGCLQRAIL
jgi:hypothetical protein